MAGTEGDAARVPLSIRLFFGSGAVAEGVKNTAFNAFLLFYYNQVLGLSGTLSGIAIFVALAVDAVTDPLVGELSDRFRSRWGRRHPFMYSAAAPMALCFVALFNPPEGLGAQELFAWLAVFAVGVRTSMTLYMIPSNSMVPEMTPNYDERTTLVSFRHLFGWMGGLGASLLGYLVFFAPNERYANGQLDPSAYGAFAVTGGAMIFTAILVCSLGTHRLIPRLRRPPEKESFTLGRLLDDLRPVTRNPSYRALLVGSLFASVAGGFSDVVGLYVNTYFWEFSTAQIANLVFAMVAAVLLAFSLTPALTRRFDKRRAALGLGTLAVFLGPLPIVLRLLGWMPPNGHPLLLPLIMAHVLLLATLIIAINISISSMLADVVDENEVATGLRQEGLFTSAISFTAKATSGIGGLVAGLALDAIAFPEQAAPGSVPPEKVAALGLVVGPGLMILYLVALAFLARYRITRARHREILAELARRRDRSQERGLGPTIQDGI